MVILFILTLICIVFSFFEAHRFIEYDGNIKRGMKISSEFLSEDIANYLRTLLSDVTDNDTKTFIKKENETVLIQPIPYIFHKNLGFWYIGVVDLSKRRLKITYYTPISGVLLIALLLSMFAFQLFTGPESEMLSSFCIVILIPFFYGISHHFSKNVVIKYIKKNMVSKHR